MELVGRREFIDVEMIDVEPGDLQRLQHRREETLSIPVCRCALSAGVAHLVVLHLWPLKLELPTTDGSGMLGRHRGELD